jgi:thiol-disulfide isomerase/thioredoxin
MQLLRIIFLSAFLLFFWGCEDKPTTKQQPQTAQVTQKPISNDLKLVGLNQESLTIDIKSNKSITIKELSGKVILLNFFATWCPPCKAEIPHLINLQDRYSKELAIVSISLDKDLPKGSMREFADKYKINYFINYGASSFDVEKKIGGIQTIPMMLLYDKNGKYVTHYSGAVPEEMIEVDIKKALQK